MVTRCGGSNEYTQSMFLYKHNLCFCTKVQKMHAPVNPILLYKSGGIIRYTFYGHISLIPRYDSFCSYQAKMFGQNSIATFLSPTTAH